jgi:hypothetical protein
LRIVLYPRRSSSQAIFFRAFMRFRHSSAEQVFTFRAVVVKICSQKRHMTVRILFRADGNGGGL